MLTLGLTIVPNFDYHGIITIGETLIMIQLLSSVLHHDTNAVSEYCRFLKNLDDMSQSLVSKLYTNAVHLECELYHQSSINCSRAKELLTTCV